MRVKVTKYKNGNGVIRWQISTSVNICVTYQSVPYIAHVDTRLLCDEVGYLTPFFTTNKSNKVEGNLTNFKKPVFRKID